jgi:hypothetical protein
MKIECHMSQSCGAEYELRENILQALALEGVKAEVDFYRLNDREAELLGLRGSPSVRINGKDIQPAEVKGFS